MYAKIVILKALSLKKWQIVSLLLRLEIVLDFMMKRPVPNALINTTWHKKESVSSFLLQKIAFKELELNAGVV